MPKLQRALTHEVFFEFIQKIIRLSIHHYHSIHQVLRLYLQQFQDVLLTLKKMPKFTKGHYILLFFSEFLQT